MAPARLPGAGAQPAAWDDALVSVVVPAYNARAWVAEAVRSVLAQSWPTLELWVVDDGSDDGCGAEALAAAAGDPRLRVIRLEANQGPVAARNAGLQAARGRYVALLDSDDRWRSDKLMLQLACLRQGGAAFCCTGFRRVRARDGRVGRLIQPPPQISYRALLRDNVIATSSVLVDRARSGDFRFPSAAREDFALWLSFLRRGLRGVGLPQDLMRYTVLPGSRSSAKLRAAGRVWRTYRDHERLSLPRSLACFAAYALNGLLKHRRL